ncbi:hypothetical protein MYX07_06045 [Patescibacteria group bacterium AH-259-L07]|nr:hypothetical protein [Patescibacteria group bacterium AH-259-L07]
MGKKSDELLRRLKQGLPADEAPALLRDVERERAQEQAPRTNPSQYKDERIQQLSDLWFSQRATATVEQKNEVGLVYISKVLGLGDDVAQRFAQGDQNAYRQVGMRQGGAENYTPDLESFWARVRELFPGIYRDDDISFLVKQNDVVATWHFLWQLEIPLAAESPILGDLAINAHVYK